MTGRVYAGLWLGWIALFAIIEGSAIITRHAQFTLSAYSWRLEQLGRPWTFVHYLIAVMAFWLFLHLTWGWWR